MIEEAINITISKNRRLSQSTDFQFLLKKGNPYLQQLSGTLWTDFNLHDPGITILESLCYALTELGLKFNLDIFDLIASGVASASRSEQPFPLQTEILPCTPLTIEDYRKLLLNVTLQNYSTLSGIINHFQPIKGVWFEFVNNPSPIFYLDRGNEALSYESGEGINIQGLYDVQFEFNHHPDYGDINTNILKRSFSIDEIILVDGINLRLQQNYQVDIAFPYWDEADSRWLNPIALNSIILSPNEDGTPGVIRPLTEDETKDFFTVLIINPQAPETDPLTQNLRLGLSLKITSPLIDDHRDVNKEELGFILNELEALLIDSSNNGPIFEFNAKVRTASTLSNTLKNTLYRHRNLCEDFVKFSAIRIQEIGIHADLDLSLGSNAEEVLIQLFWALELFFAANVTRHSLEDYQQKLLEKKQNVEIADVFEGPLIENGFIKEDDFNRFQALEAIYTSDVLSTILSTDDRSNVKAISQITGINNLSLSNYINNQEINSKIYDCLVLTQPQIYRPRLSVSKSRINCFQGGNLVNISLDRIISALDRLKDLASVNQPTPLYGTEPPKGEAIPLKEYYSIQEHFPAIYRLGKGQITSAVSEKEIAQIQQLKGYLMLFEQLLADYSAQAHNINRLLSIGAHELSSYYSQTLINVPGARAILAPDLDTEEEWLSYMANPNNTYLNSFVESNSAVIYSGNQGQIARFENFLTRRLNLLDHQIGRYNEDLSTYAQQRINSGLKSANTPDEARRRSLEEQQEILFDKSIFLKDYPNISKIKPLAFNYRDSNAIWNTEQVSGLEKRIARALGIRVYSRRNLFQQPSILEPDFQIIGINIGGTPFHVVEFIADGSSVLLRSLPYPTLPLAEAAIGTLATFGQKKSAFRYETLYDSTNGVQYIAHVHDDNDQRIASSPVLTTEEDRAVLIERVLLWLYEKYSGEGLFLLEHILLRPYAKGATLADSDSLLPLHLNDADTIVNDPYSFRISIFLPSGKDNLGNLQTPRRFGDDEFRQLAEVIIHQETPAHIKPYIHWLDQMEMEGFQQSFRDWLERLNNPSTGGISLQQAQQNLITFITPWLDLTP